MLRQRLFNYTILVFLTGVSTFILFTDVYLNAFPAILKAALAADDLKYRKIHGNLIKGFEIENFFMSTGEYNLESEKINIEIVFSDIFNGFSDIDYLKIEEGALKLKKPVSEYFYQEGNYKVFFNKIDLIKSKIIIGSNNIYCNKINIDKLSNISGEAKLFLSSGHIFDIQKAKIRPNGNLYEYSFFIKNVNFESAGFSDISILGNFHSIDRISSEFNISEAWILNEKFEDLFGEIEYYNNKILIDMPSEFTDINESVIGGRIEIKNNVINAINVVFKIQNASPLLMKDQELFISDSLFGKNVYIGYKNGGILAKDFSIKSFNDYYFDIMFENFDITLFRGLNASGYLSGSLYISNENWIAQSDTKIKNFSYNGKYEIDEIQVEKPFKSDNFNIDNLRVSKKKVGFLDISLFYNEIIHRVLERKKIEF